MGDKYNKGGSNDIHYVGLLAVVPIKYAKGQQSNSHQLVTKKSTVDKQRQQSNSHQLVTKKSTVDKQRQQSNSHQLITKKSTVDKQSGCYAKTSVKQSYSSGDAFKERSTGRVGYKDEFKTTKTCKVGNKSGYTEYQVVERFRRVDYGSGSSTDKNKKYLK